MICWLFVLALFPSTLFAAGAWVPARDYWGPEDSEGFLQPILPPPFVEAPKAARPPLQVTSLNKKGFLHRSRRQAEALEEGTLELQEYARIYSPSQSYLAIRHADDALIILHPQTSISARPEPDHWQLSLTGDRGLVRITTHQHSLPFSLKPANPRNAWQNLELELHPGSDLYLKYDRETLIVHPIRGRLLMRLGATRPLQTTRPSGLLQTWEETQVRRPVQAPYEFDVFAGQELRLEADELFHFQISLPRSETWQSTLLRTSPQLAESVDKDNPLTTALLDLRRTWLKLWNGEDAANKETLYRRLEAGRWEEAHEILKTFETDLEFQALQAVCLYRLHQIELADKKQAGIDASSLWADITKQEYLRARLRSKARRAVNPPQDFRHAVIPLEELYLLASNEQARGRWRAALDLWERWPETQSDEQLQESYKEWQRHLDQKKPWRYEAQLALGWSDNVLHLPSDEAAPAAIGHRSSWLLQASQTLPYLIERSDDFSVQLEPTLHVTLYQHIGLADLQRWEPGLALPLRMQSLRFKPYVSRLQQGSGGLDRFGYELSWQNHAWLWSPEFSWTQEQNLDFAPTVERSLDPLSGERIGTGDRSVRRNTLRVRAGSLDVLWQNWDYRYAGSEEDDRNRLMVRGHYQKEFPYDLQLNASGSLHQDSFQGSRSPVTGLHLRIALTSLYWHRLLPSLAIEREMRQSADSTRSFTENLIFAGLHYRW
ncbi:autotransporter outer membrane beta-barrel domain-containing protein [Oligoflexus tunisiensis]|uniref:autotransporter outer membrane beta-barrel domain-containing protein n=1 Tax=Oligoflexus tunisiensis TaxID=708132 RepID=UPI00114CB46C|nr:autotransporter outer membrane beta-barrel domain-containing protein [Oligoflexus tunisiensis]